MAVVEDGNQLYGYILREHIGHRGSPLAVQGAQGQLIEYAQHQTGLLAGKIHRNPEIGPHQLHQMGGGEGGGGLKAHLLKELAAHEREGGGGRQLAVGPAAVRQEVLEASALGTAGGGEGVGEGGLGGDGQAVVPLHAALLAQPDQAQHRPGHALLTGDALLAGDLVRVKGDGINLLVGDQDLPVAVGDAPPGALHGLGGCHLGGGAGQILAAIDDLRRVEDADKEDQAQGKNEQEDICPPVETLFICHGRTSFRSGRQGERWRYPLPASHVFPGSARQ